MSRLAGFCLALVLAGAAPAGEPLAVDERLGELLTRKLPESVDDLRSLQDQLRRVVAAARPATVSIEMGDSVGSGVIISREGLVLTAGHVSVEPNRKVWVRFPDDRRVEARSLGVNHPVDSGLVRITATPPTGEDGRPGGWPFVPIAEHSVESGDWVVGLGQPNGYVIGRAPPVRLGRVLDAKDEAINTDVTLVGGDSGGPLLNLRGEVVGIHSRIGERITSNYHVPITSFRRDWDRLVAGTMTGVPDGEDPGDTRPSVGVAVRETNDGLVITQVFPGMPAEEAGLEKGDVIVSLGGRQVGTHREINAIARSLKPYDRAPITVLRDDSELELQVWLGRVPTEFPGMAQDGTPRRRRWRSHP